MRSRTQLIRQRVALRTKAPARTPGNWSASDYQLWYATKQLRAATRRRDRQRQKRLCLELAEAWTQRKLHACHKLAHLIAGRRLGPRTRRYGHLPAARPGVDEWATALQKEVHEGGMLATIICYEEEVARLQKEHQ